MKKILILCLFLTNTYALQLLESNDNNNVKLEDKSISQIKNLAMSGDPSSQFELANIYSTGSGVEKNEKLAFYWYKQVAKNNYANAQFNVANSYYNGKGVEKNVDSAIVWYQKAAKQNLVPAIYNLAYIFENDKKNTKQGFNWYKKAAGLGHGISQLIVANKYSNGSGVDKNNELATKWFNLAISNKVKDSNYEFAEFLLKNKKNQEAIKFYKKASKNHSILANYKLANIYLEGKITKQDKKLAMHFLTESAKKDYAPAQQLLGLIYGIKKDYKNSISWYKKSAENGDAKAQYSLGVLYLKGIGVEKDIYKSTELFIKSASGGNTKAQYSLAIRYIAGDGIEKNYYEAIKWLKRAADKNHPNAAYSMSLRYKLGQGVKQDKSQRIKWLEKSKKIGNLNAKYELSALTLSGEKTTISEKNALENLQEFSKNSNLSAGSNYHLGKFYLKSNPTLAKKYLLTSNNLGNKFATKLLNKVTLNPALKKAVATQTTAIKTKPKLKPVDNKKINLKTQSVNAQSIYRLAISYLNNSKNQEDFIVAFKEMETSAKLGFPPAQNDLALMHLNGMGTKINLEKALKFAKMAKDNNYLPATQILIHIQNAKNKSSQVK
jgi:TPR repeat protein